MKDVQWQIPGWIPTKKLVMMGLMVAFFMGVAAFMWWQAEQTRQATADVDNAIAVQKVLEPYVQRVHAQQKRVNERLQGIDSEALPADLPQLLMTLQRLSHRAGLTGAQFLPVSESLVKTRTLELTGSCQGSTEALRRFVVLLSNQSWVDRVGRFHLRAGSQAHTAEVSLWAHYAIAEQPNKAEAVR